VAVLAAGFVMMGCGTAELAVEPTFDGTWTVTELASGGTAVDLVGQPVEIEIDTGQAAVRGRTNCQRLFGSYTLDGADESSAQSNGAEGGGDASFTIPSPEASADCAAADRAVHIDLVEALESVTLWRREGPTLTLSSPSGSLLVLQGQTRGE
jgi:heat shock protein HslJ